MNKPAKYEAPKVEKVVKSEDFQRESVYAAIVSSN